jgi:transposase
MFQLAQMLAQIYGALRTEVRQHTYLQIDETPVRYINPGNGVCSKGCLWVYNVPRNLVLFEWHTGRGHECMETMLDGFKGHVQSDGYSAYETFRKKNPEINLLCCWAHARRKFDEARLERSFAVRMIEEIANLYGVEKTLRENPALDRRTLRQKESVPVLSRMRLELMSEQPKHLPQSLTRKAIDYALARWDKLNVYTGNSALEIDNNLVENAIRPTAAGKKNWLFFGGANGGQTSAIFYSLLSSCSALGINPEEYLREVFAVLPEMTNQSAKEWTPSAWKTRRNAAQG